MSKQDNLNNAAQFQHDLSNAFSSFPSYTDPNMAWQTWKEIFLEIADLHAPVRRRKVKSEYKPWLTNEIKTMSYHRDYLKKKAISLKSETFYESYKRCRKQVNRVIKEAKANYYKSKLENSNKGIARFFLTCLMDLISTLLQVLFSSITVAILANL